MKFNFSTVAEEDLAMTTVTMWEPIDRVKEFVKDLKQITGDNYGVKIGDIVERDDAFVLELWVVASNPDRIKWMLRKAGIKNYNHLRI